MTAVVVPDDAWTARRRVHPVAVEVLRGTASPARVCRPPGSPRSVVHRASLPFGVRQIDHARVSLGIGRHGAAVLANGLDEATKENTATRAEAPATVSSPAASQASAAATEPPASAEPTTTPTDEDRVAKVGATQWFEYADGMKVQVTSLKRFRISQYAAGGKPGDVGVIVTVTLQNGCTNTFDTGEVSCSLGRSCCLVKRPRSRPRIRTRSWRAFRQNLAGFSLYLRDISPTSGTIFRGDGSHCARVRQHFLYLLVEPHQQGLFRPGGQGVWGVAASTRESR